MVHIVCGCEVQLLTLQLVIGRCRVKLARAAQSLFLGKEYLHTFSSPYSYVKGVSAVNSMLSCPPPAGPNLGENGLSVAVDLGLLVVKRFEYIGE